MVLPLQLFDPLGMGGGRRQARAMSLVTWTPAQRDGLGVHQAAA